MCCLGPHIVLAPLKWGRDGRGRESSSAGGRKRWCGLALWGERGVGSGVVCAVAHHAEGDGGGGVGDAGPRVEGGDERERGQTH